MLFSVFVLVYCLACSWSFLLQPLPFRHRPDLRKQSSLLGSLETDAGDWISVSPDDWTAGERYGFLISAVVPRPVAVITTKSSSRDKEDGIVNCAPFSYTSLSSHDPPIVTHGICLKGGGQKKDTLINIEDTKEWVFNILSTNYVEKANECAASLPTDEDEITAFGLSALPSVVVGPPRLQDAKVALECQLWDFKEVYNDNGDHTTTIVMGRVVQFHIHSSVLKDAPERDGEGPNRYTPPLFVDLEKLQAVGRAGDITYWPFGVSDASTEMKAIPRPK